MKSAHTYSILIALCVCGTVAAGPAAPPSGSLTIAEWTPEQIQRRHDRLKQFVEQAPDPSSRANRALLAALDLMGTPLAPAATRRVLDRSQTDDDATVAAAVQAARVLLADARSNLDRVEVDPETDAPDTWEFTMDLEAAQAMAEALAAIWDADDGNEAERDTALQEAAAGLVVVLEDDRPEVVAAAKLWLAEVYRQRALNGRAIQILPNVLETPARPSAHAFYASWLHCSQLAASTEWMPTALALSARLAEQSRLWFEDAAESDRAERTAALLHRRLLVRWEQELNAQGMTASAAWCRDAVKGVDDTYFAISDELLPLDTAVPPLRDLAEVSAFIALKETPATAPASPPATKVPAAPTTDLGASPLQSKETGTNGPIEGEKPVMPEESEPSTPDEPDRPKQSDAGDQR